MKLPSTLTLSTFLWSNKSKHSNRFTQKNHQLFSVEETLSNFIHSLFRCNNQSGHITKCQQKSMRKYWSSLPKKRKLSWCAFKKDLEQIGTKTIETLKDTLRIWQKLYSNSKKCKLLSVKDMKLSFRQFSLCRIVLSKKMFLMKSWRSFKKLSMISVRKKCLTYIFGFLNLMNSLRVFLPRDWISWSNNGWSNLRNSINLKMVLEPNGLMKEWDIRLSLKITSFILIPLSNMVNSVGYRNSIEPLEQYAHFRDF